ncbi:MAG: ribonuclease P protein component [Proteobacteria bacterium]|nr:ribonuclease P protein component [Pseudomonadota bacterium]
MNIGHGEGNKIKPLKGACQFRGPFNFTSKNKIFFVGLKARCGENGDTRLGIVITKKICPRAVDRNRLRRAVRESARMIFYRRANIDVVVKVRGFVPKIAQKKAVRSLNDLFRGLLSENVSNICD